LDNSFNLEINGTKLAPLEMQFFAPILATGESMIGFTSDNSGISNIFERNRQGPGYIWDGVETGEVTLLGKRTPTSTFEAMSVINGADLNDNITWNSNASNTVVVSQIVFGPTALSGLGLGFLNCIDTDNDGIVNSLDLDSDNDGCPDFAEGAGSFDVNTDGVTAQGTLSSGTGSTVDTNLGNVVDNNGQVTEVNGATVPAADQGTGTSQDGRNSAACPPVAVDSDGDGVNDDVDLDDDNDGILDLVEILNLPLINHCQTYNLSF